MGVRLVKAAVFSYIDPSPSALNGEGPLFGKRATVQASIAVKGWPTEANSPALHGYLPLEDATVVERLKSAGAILVGNTQSSELGFGLFRDGAARALTEGHGDVALMTDTMGEARVAAASAGLFGFKPSYGRVSRFGLVGLVPSMDCCSILGKDSNDLAAVFHAIAGPDERDPSLADDPAPNLAPRSDRKAATPVVGFVAECLETLDRAEGTAFRKALARLEQAGCEIREVAFADFDLFRAAHNLIGSVEASSSCGKFDGVRYGHRAAGGKNWNEMYLQSRGESFSLLLKAYLFQGAYFQFRDYPAFERACRIRARLVKESRSLFRRVDLLASPTRRAILDPGRAGTVDEVYDVFSLTLPANLTGQPALTLPGFLTDQNGDRGLQLVGPCFGDEQLLELGWQLSRPVEGAR